LIKLPALPYNKLIVFGLFYLACFSAYAESKPWTKLTPQQQEALAPLAKEWNSLPEMQQKRLLATTKRFHQLSPDKKKVFLTRLTEWSNLTPAQRNQARKTYKAFSEAAPDKREEIRRIVLESEAEHALPASGVLPQTASGVPAEAAK